MDNFDLRKYLAEGRLLKEEKEDRFSGPDPRAGSTIQGRGFERRGEEGIEDEDGEYEASLDRLRMRDDRMQENEILKEDEQPTHRITVDVYYDEDTGEAVPEYELDDAGLDVDDFESVYIDEGDEGWYKDGEFESEAGSNTRLNDFDLRKYLAENKLLKEDIEEISITGDYMGEPEIYSGHNFGKFLKEMLELALNEDDFVNKVIMGVTDETSSISREDEIKVRQYYEDKGGYSVPPHAHHKEQDEFWDEMNSDLHPGNMGDEMSAPR